MGVNQGVYVTIIHSGFDIIEWLKKEYCKEAVILVEDYQNNWRISRPSQVSLNKIIWSHQFMITRCGIKIFLFHFSTRGRFRPQADAMPLLYKCTVQLTTSHKLISRQFDGRQFLRLLSSTPSLTDNFSSCVLGSMIEQTTLLSSY
jgi:hypothetical protein